MDYLSYSRFCEIGELVGKTFDSVTKGSGSDSDSLIFSNKGERLYQIGHVQDCCESVTITDVAGELKWLENSPILISDARTGDTEEGEYGDITRWTFYTFSTSKGTVVVRWDGSSNGYYGVGVDCLNCKEEEN